MSNTQPDSDDVIPSIYTDEQRDAGLEFLDAVCKLYGLEWEFVTTPCEMFRYASKTMVNVELRFRTADERQLPCWMIEFANDSSGEDKIGHLLPLHRFADTIHPSSVTRFSETAAIDRLLTTFMRYMCEMFDTFLVCDRDRDDDTVAVYNRDTFLKGPAGSLFHVNSGDELVMNFSLTGIQIPENLGKLFDDAKFLADDSHIKYY